MQKKHGTGIFVAAFLAIAGLGAGCLAEPAPDAGEAAEEDVAEAEQALKYPCPEMEEECLAWCQEQGHTWRGWCSELTGYCRCELP